MYLGSEHQSMSNSKMSISYQSKNTSNWPQMIMIGPILKPLLPSWIHIYIRHKCVKFLNYFSGFATKLDTKGSRRLLERNLATHTRTITNTVSFVQNVFVLKYPQYSTMIKYLSAIHLDCNWLCKVSVFDKKKQNIMDVKFFPM